MEYAYDDWCLAQMAKILGKEEDYEHYMERASNYRNLFNPETGFFQGKNADGSWQRQIAIEKFDTLLREDRNIRDGSNRNTYSIDLSHLIKDNPDRTIYVCFSDSIKEDGWGPSVWHFALEGDGKTFADFDVNNSAGEKEYLYKDSNTAIDNDHRFADGNSYWMYRFTIPKGVKTLVARVNMSNQFRISASSSPEPEPFDPTVQYGFYTEGNAWQWSFFAPQDIDGLIELMGGRDAFVERLDSMFEQEPVVKGSPDISGLIGQYAHGNEPSHHITYLYDYAGMPWKTQERVRQVMEELYGTGADGLCGNEDCGQMSAWYVFSSMGFYPVCPGEARYAIGSPIFDKVTIHMTDGRDLVIEARSNSTENRYIQSATLNGEVLDDPWLEHSTLKNGGTLVFEMGSAPNKEWAGESAREPLPIGTTSVSELLTDSCGGEALF
jgi:putative alpha-1,2-mannosidase